MRGSTDRPLAARIMGVVAGVAIIVTACGSSGTPGPASATPAVPAPATPTETQPLASVPAATTITPAPTRSQAPTPAPTATPTPAPTPSPSPTPTPAETEEPSPTPSPTPVTSIPLDATLVASYIADNNWQRTNATGTAVVSATLVNNTAWTAYPVCRVTFSATRPTRLRHLFWRGNMTVRSGTSVTLRMELPKVPVSVDASWSGVSQTEDIVCTGSVARPKGAVAQAKLSLPVKLGTSHGSQPVNRRSTITFSLSVRNTETAKVRAGCRVQVSDTTRRSGPLAAGDRVKVFTFSSSTWIKPGKTAILTFTGRGAPVHVSATRYSWWYSARCWSR